MTDEFQLRVDDASPQLNYNTYEELRRQNRLEYQRKNGLDAEGKKRATSAESGLKPDHNSPQTLQLQQPTRTHSTSLLNEKSRTYDTS